MRLEAVIAAGCLMLDGATERDHKLLGE